MSDVWDLEGYDVQALIGFGATGEVWRARELASGDTVALKRLREGADSAALEALRREATLLRTLDTPFVVRLRDVVGDVLVLDHAPGGSLAGLLARRGCLDAGEVVTIAAPLASALATAHGLGLVHGDVSPANVLFTADGMPLLADLGVARVAGERLATVDGTAEYVDPAVAAGADPDPASDVWALAAVCHHLLAGTPPHDGDSPAAVLDAAVAGQRAPLGLLAPTAPRALVAAVEAGLAVDPASRPGAAAFASLLRRSHAAAPVRLTGGPPVHEPPRETHVVRVAPPVPAAPRARRRLPRQAVPLGALGALVLLAAVIGWVSGRGEVPAAAAVTPLQTPSAAPAKAGVAVPDPAAAPSSTPVPTATASTAAGVDWAVLLEGLDDARARAFTAADPAELAAVWAPGSAGLAADTRAVEALAAAGRTAHGLRHTVRDVEVRSVGGGRAQLRVVDVLAAYEVRDAAGQVVSRAAERGSTGWVVELMRAAAGWQLLSLTPA